MITKSFCEQYVSLIDRPARRKSTLDLIKIVEQGVSLPIERMYSYNDMRILYEDAPIAKIYQFVKYNQSLWVYNEVGSV